MNFGRYSGYRRNGRFGLRVRLSDLALLLPVALVVVALGGGIGAIPDVRGLTSWLLGARSDGPAIATATYSRNFGGCAHGVRITCVVDGDTFWLDGIKYRIADINTPEIGSPQCPEEARMGRLASQRLQELLSAAPFTLVNAGRDEDRYGRKLRVVERDGHSIGAQLVAEGLAEEWRGTRGSWC